MAHMMLINPRSRRRTKKRRRKNPESRAERSRAAKLGWRRRRHHRRRNSWPDDHKGHRAAALKGWRGRRRHHTRRRRRNPITGGATVMQLVGESAMMSLSAIGIDVLWGFLPIPDTIKGNSGMNAAAKGTAAVLLGYGVGMVTSERTGEIVAAGGLTIALYDAWRSLITSLAPNISLGYYGSGTNVGSMGVYLPAEKAAPAPSASAGGKPTGMGYYMPRNAT